MAAPATVERDRPRLAEGVELIGEYEGSGYKEPPSLARRPDGQVIQLTPLLYSVAGKIDGSHDVAEIAAQVGGEIGRRVSPDNIRVLVEQKLRPLGIVVAADGSPPEVQKADPLLALKFRTAVVSERTSRALAAAFRPLLLPPVVLGVLAALVFTDAWVFFHHGVAQATRQALYAPGSFLLIFAALVVSAAFHEIGHATACRYSGGEPGRMGCGLYLAWPAFYTDVTDAYRLGRAGRLRTDLGGVYFNVVVVVATMGTYLLTRFEPLLLLIVVEHLEIAHQLLPIVRLDGYYIVADLTGVPDLFNRIRPILASALPWRKTDERVKVLKRWVRVAVTAWVLVVVPLLVLQLLVLLVQLPRILGTAWDSLGHQVGSVDKAFARGNALGAVSSILQVVVLALPVLGILLMLARVAQRTGRAAWLRTEGRPWARAGVLVLAAAGVGLLVYVWVPKGDYRPIRPGERGTIQQGIRAMDPGRLPKLRGRPLPPLPVDRASPAGTSRVAPTTTVGTATTVPSRRSAVTTPATAVTPTVARQLTATTRSATATTVARRTTVTTGG